MSNEVKLSCLRVDTEISQDSSSEMIRSKTLINDKLKLMSPGELDYRSIKDITLSSISLKKLTPVKMDNSNGSCWSCI